jgi:acetyl/propionyl-CoA carboxylase alpha subunit
MRILIANRGEIARRIVRTAHALGHETVAVWADPDRDAPFTAEASVATHLGPAALGESYLSIERLLDAAKRSDASAVHPGYGFLAESAAFARAVVAAGLTWIGPRADAIEQMGSKIEARRLAAAARVPTIPGFDEAQDPDALARAAAEIGYPVLVKAAAGGGGKGIRIVDEPAGFTAALAEARREAERAFGDGNMIVERYVQRPRHVEVQVVGDRHGTLIELGTRECSVQRRYQKLLEEAPAPELPEATRDSLCAAAAELARSIGYDSTGTVEFIVDDESGEFFFLEMNTRLQVEHPVTEAVTGLDLVELQIRVADGEPLPLSQDEVALVGHAFEVRINAEDPSAGFVPGTGTVTHLRVPDGVRFESGVELGSRITTHYDPLLAKLVVAGPDRAAARRRLASALDELILGGLVTNAGFHRWLLEQPPIVAGRVTTRFLDETERPPEPDRTGPSELAARAWVAALARARPPGPWGALGPFRLTPHRFEQTVLLEDREGDVDEVSVSPDPLPLDTHLTVSEDGVARRVPVSVDAVARSVAVNVAGHTHTFRIVSRSEHWAPASALDHGAAEVIAAPFPGVVTEVAVTPGQSVVAGDVVAVIEAMKMLHSLAARGQGVVDEVRVAAGDSVESSQVLVTFRSEPGPSSGD